MATRITLSGGNQYEVTEVYADVARYVNEGWTGAVPLTTTAGPVVLVRVPEINSVQAT